MNNAGEAGKRRVLIRSHGVSPNELEQLRLAGNEVLDLTCPFVSRLHAIVEESSRDGTPVILEINTIPGMTETSLLPDSARHAGIEFPELCRRFVEWALE